MKIFHLIFLILALPILSLAQTAGNTRYSGGALQFNNGSTWVSTDQGNTGIGCTTAGSIRYNTGANRSEFCNGTNWRSMDFGAVVSGTGSAGDTRYSDTTLQFHNGTNWVRTAAPLCAGGFSSGGYCYFLASAVSESCETTCGNRGRLCNLAGTQAASTSGAGCQAILTGLGRSPGGATGGAYAYGCSISAGNAVRFHTTPASVTCSASNGTYLRACSCDSSPPNSPVFIKQSPLTAAAEAASHTTTFATLPNPGTTIVVYTATWKNAAHDILTTGVTDNSGNTYYQTCKTAGTFGGSNYVTGIFYAKNVTVTGGTFTVTVTPTTTSEMLLRAIEYSGLDPTNPLDQNTNYTATSTSASSGTTAVTTETNELLAAVLDLDSGGGVSITETGGFTGRGSTSGGTNPMGGFADKIVSGKAAYNASWTLGASTPYISCIATFKPPASGTAPTFVQEAETAWGTMTSPKTTASFNVLAGDVLVAYAGNENGAETISSISGGGLTWTLQQSIELGGTWANVYVWTAVVDTNKSMTVTFNASGSATRFGGNVLTFRGSSGIGASSKTNVASGAPSLNITTTGTNSAVVVFNNDWNAVDGASRAWRGTFSERTYNFTSGQYTVFGGYHANMGPAGTYTVGLTAPTAQKYSIIAVEVKAAP